MISLCSDTSLASLCATARPSRRSVQMHDCAGNINPQVVPSGSRTPRTMQLANPLLALLALGALARAAPAPAASTYAPTPASFCERANKVCDMAALFDDCSNMYMAVMHACVRPRPFCRRRKLTSPLGARFRAAGGGSWTRCSTARPKRGRRRRTCRRRSTGARSWGG